MLVGSSHADRMKLSVFVSIDGDLRKHHVNHALLIDVSQYHSEKIDQRNSEVLTFHCQIVQLMLWIAWKEKMSRLLDTHLS